MKSFSLTSLAFSSACVRSSDEPNDCRPNMNMLWGRRTCEHAQRTETRNIPNADENPYKWFAINMGFTPRESVCVMGTNFAVL